MQVLSAVVALLGQSYMVTVSDIAGRTGLELAEVAQSLDAMNPTYVDFRKTETGGDPTFWYVLKVTPEARRAVGQWPTAEGLIDRLAQAFSDAADHEEDGGGFRSEQMRAVVLADGWRAAVAQGIEDPDGLSFHGQLPGIGLTGPAERDDLVVLGEPAAEHRAAEHQRDDAEVHVLVDAGQRGGLDIQSGFLADLAA